MAKQKNPRRPSPQLTRLLKRDPMFDSRPDSAVPSPTEQGRLSG